MLKVNGHCRFYYFFKFFAVPLSCDFLGDTSLMLSLEEVYSYLTEVKLGCMMCFDQ